MEHAIFSEEQNAIVADGQSIVALFNYKLQRTGHITDDILRVMSKTEGREIARD